MIETRQYLLQVCVNSQSNIALIPYSSRARYNKFTQYNFTVNNNKLVATSYIRKVQDLKLQICTSKLSSINSIPQKKNQQT